MNTMKEKYTYAYDNRTDCDTLVTITHTKHTPIISLREISLDGGDNWCLAVCLSPSSDCDLFSALDKRLALSKSVFILQIRRSAHVIKDGADLFVADQVGIVHAACLRGNLS